MKKHSMTTLLLSIIMAVFLSYGCGGGGGGKTPQGEPTPPPAGGEVQAPPAGPIVAPPSGGNVLPPSEGPGVAPPAGGEVQPPGGAPVEPPAGGEVLPPVIQPPGGLPVEPPAEPDIIPPVVSNTVPQNGDKGVAVNTSITATFSETINKDTINEDTFVIKLGGNKVQGRVIYKDMTATFIPNAALMPEKDYDATITKGVADPVGNKMAGNYDWTFTTGAVVNMDKVPPRVLFTLPKPQETGVPINTAIEVGFSEPVAAESVPGNLRLTDATGKPFDGVVEVRDSTAVFRPAVPLLQNTTYIFTVLAGIADLAGNVIAGPYEIKFLTAQAPDLIPLRVTSIEPANGAVGVPLNSVIKINFSKEINPATATPHTIFILNTKTGMVVGGQVVGAGDSATFTPDADLQANTAFKVTVKGAVTDLAGNRMAEDFFSDFTTGAAADIILPTVTVVSPGENSVDVPTNVLVTATFSKPVDKTTIVFTLRDAERNDIAGDVTYDGASATFKPGALLRNAARYFATIGGGLMDAAGNKMGADKVWSFATGGVADADRPQIVSTEPVDGGGMAPVTTDIRVTFNEAMHADTPSGIHLYKTGVPDIIPADASLDATRTTVVTLNPAANLEYATKYEYTVEGTVKDVAGNEMGGAQRKFSFSTEQGPERVAPKVDFVIPPNGGEGVVTNANVQVVFTEAMNEETINADTFKLTPTGTQDVVMGNIVKITEPSDDDAQTIATVVTFTPTNLLAGRTQYTLTVEATVADLVGNPMVAAYTSSFTTGEAPDIEPPTIAGRNPAPGAVDILIDDPITVTFNEAIDISSDANFAVDRVAGHFAVPVGGILTYDDATKTATFRPTQRMDANTSYVVTINGDIDSPIRDLSGNVMQGTERWTFDTGVLRRDNEAPNVDSITPINGAVGVLTNANITIRFTEEMDPRTITLANILLRKSDGGAALPIEITLGDNNTVAIVNSVDRLATDVSYTISIPQGVTDRAGNSLVPHNFSSQFTTIRLVPLPPRGGDLEPIPPPGGALPLPPPERLGISSISPEDNAINVGLNTAINIEFDHAINPQTISDDNIDLCYIRVVLGIPLPIKISVPKEMERDRLNGTRLKIVPNENLRASTTYYIVVTTDVRGVGDERLGEDFESQFRTMWLLEPIP